ncbi:hypothetical protein MEBOL_004627 [Melittangium boletus DSM 14713]|uniref:Protein kinase n=1 Tax=Melittangium boletus DSM 14713 TaxID=1294270 RepID=A0A250IHE3_9BACT|nr:hypothetical protein [Melittangium boletus]ATB31165.1 hypothetical protein MEBOL_004627 [Melittangium boletus DSM 14713]
MANETNWKDGGLEAFERGRQYEEVGPDLGSLHEAWHVRTGQPALVLQPSSRMDWQPEGVWRMRLACHAHTSTVKLWVDEAPASASMAELANILVLMTAAVVRVEGNPQVRAHLTSGLAHPEPAAPRPRRRRHSARRTLTLSAGLALVLFFWMCPSNSLGRLSAPATQDASYMVDAEHPAPRAPAYPMPEKPFRNQATPPCKPRRSHFEINGGCWVEIAHKPPCDQEEAEYKGKCYLPVAKPQPLPQAVEP